MKKRFKFAIMSLILFIGIGLGAGQVYAASVLNTNIIDLIKTQFGTLTNSYTSKAASDIDSTKSAAAANINKHVSDKSGQALDELNQFNQSEVQRGTTDINKYVDEVKNEVDTAIDSEKDKAKTSVTNQVNSKVSETKSAIEAQLQQSIKDNLQPKQ